MYLPAAFRQGYEASKIEAVVLQRCFCNARPSRTGSRYIIIFL